MDDSAVLNIVLPTDNVGETREFFASTFGFPVKYESETTVFFDCGDVNLAIHEIESESFAAERPGSFYLDVAVEDIDAFKESIEAELVEEEWADEIGEFVLMREPNGNFIEVLEPRE